MLHNHFCSGKPVTFKHFSRKSYAVFRSLKREVRIGVMSVVTLTYANPECVSASPVLHVERPDTNNIRSLRTAEVTGTRTPLAAEKAARMVTVVTRETISHLAVQSITDLLKQVASVDVRQRGGFGIQSDISIDGGTFDQLTLLLNGISITNPQTGHLAADFPVDIADIERIEILEGAAGRVFGSQAFSGAINIVTRSGNDREAGARLEGGSFGTVGGGAHLNLGNRSGFNRLSGNLRRSDGGTPNSDFWQGKAFYNGSYARNGIKLDWQAGYSKQAYGANTFYSAAYPNQWEENERVIASVKGETQHGRLHLTPSASWVRTSDHFQLIRNSQTGENFHRHDVLTAGVNGWTQWIAGRTAVGMELRHEGILSTNLGKPIDAAQQVPIHGENGRMYTHRDNRTNLSLFAEHTLTWKHWTLSLGALANRNSAIDETLRWYPGIDLSFRPRSGWTLFASWNKAQRLPTFTDLYYKSPTLKGNVGLKPEKTSSLRLGSRWRNTWLAASVTGFYTRGSNMIDWVMYHADDTYHATSFELDNYGYSATATADFTHRFGANSFIRSASASYAYIYQDRKDGQDIYKSNYALEYLRHKSTFMLRHRIFGKLDATWTLRWQKRMGAYQRYDGTRPTGELTPYRPYALLDCKMQWTEPKATLYLSLNNITSHTYYDIGNIRQPGFWLMAGVSYNIGW